MRIRAISSLGIKRNKDAANSFFFYSSIVSFSVIGIVRDLEKADFAVLNLIVKVCMNVHYNFLSLSRQLFRLSLSRCLLEFAIAF